MTGGTRPAVALPSLWTQRVGPLSKVPGLLREYGADPSSVLGQAGLSADALSHPENPIPYVAAMRLLSESIRQTRCEHFALVAGRQWHLSDLGLVGELGRHCETVGEALRTITVYQQLNAHGGAPYLVEDAGTVTLGYAVYHPDAKDAFVAQEVVMVMIANIARELAGGEPRFIALTLPRPAPPDVTPYREHFRCTVRFDSPHAALYFPASLMRQRVPGADATARRRLQAEANRRLDPPFEFSLYRSLSVLLMMGMPSGDAVAQQLAMHRRTLNRRLEARGTTFQSVLDEVRFEFARQLLRNTEIPIADIAATLGYAESSSFARAFRRWSGQAPLNWRRAEQGLSRSREVLQR